MNIDRIILCDDAITEEVELDVNAMKMRLQPSPRRELTDFTKPKSEQAGETEQGGDSPDTPKPASDPNAGVS